jgi:AraC-like DNA-binding protein
MQLLDPPVNPSARGLWYQSKITEILAHFLFQPEAPTELFCEQQHRLNRERCERVLFLLRRDMENPPSLQMLADEVGCSPFYLSRLFAQEIGMGIPKALRKLRIERAAELIREHGTSVTDAAMQVGYSSLGAFNKAFQEIIGCNPGQLRRGGMSFDPR